MPVVSGGCLVGVSGVLTTLGSPSTRESDRCLTPWTPLGRTDALFAQVFVCVGRSAVVHGRGEGSGMAVQGSRQCRRQSRGPPPVAPLTRTSEWRASSSSSRIQLSTQTPASMSGSRCASAACLKRQALEAQICCEATLHEAWDLYCRAVPLLRRQTCGIGRGTLAVRGPGLGGYVICWSVWMQSFVGARP